MDINENNKVNESTKTIVPEGNKENPESVDQPEPTIISETHSSNYTSKNLNTLYPSENLWTTQKDGTVRLRMTEKGGGSEPPQTVVAMLLSTSERIPNNAALCRFITLVKISFLFNLKKKIIL
ncbi:hypothetical protein SNE40_018110 [Patella caerulea]|uniref:Uncharacterized protein n=1 Tax=Patella caerulea TaxID=87958 RepID=A0AAN8JA33_PATCE